MKLKSLFPIAALLGGLSAHAPLALAAETPAPAASPGPAAAAEPIYTLDELLHLARAGNRALLAARDQVDVARAGIQTAGAFPNPEVEYLSGRARARQPGANPGDVSTMTVTQPLPLPGQRGLRQGVATAGAEAATAGLSAFAAETEARVKLGYYELLRREAEFLAAREDQSLITQIRSRIKLRVDTGEAPRYELIKADAELLNAEKTLSSSQLRVAQARAALRQAVGDGLPLRFGVRGQFADLDADAKALPAFAALRDEVLARNPELARTRAETERAERQLQLERALRAPSVAVRASRDRDPDLDTSRFGLVVTVPLWDRRGGPVAEAGANLSRARNELASREFTLLQSLETAYRNYEIASTQLSALEGGILHQAKAAMKVAEAAYRFGERGILDYLDAQRVFRAARGELIAARFELAAALIEIERLRPPAEK
ncbi:MAG: hypothetical protein C0466_09235 [Candidatus Accumulibacter sp.]|nr:hypothetical protein [Accumulibacter sp.]